MARNGLFDTATGVWIGAATAPFRSSERNLHRKLWRHDGAGDTIVADSGFCRWFTLYLFNRRGVKAVMRNKSIRKSDPRAAKLGKGDGLNAGGTQHKTQMGCSIRLCGQCLRASRSAS